MYAFKIRYSPSASEDLEQIEAYIARENPVAARWVVQRIFNSLSTISFFPSLGHAMPGHSYRVLVSGNYMIFYRIIKQTKTIRVLRVLDTRRDLTTMIS